MAALNEAIRAAEQAVNMTPENYLDRVERLHYLGIRLSARYSRTGAIADLEEAIRLARRVVDMTPRDDRHWAGRLNDLGNRIGDRFLRTGDITDLEESIQIGRQVVDTVSEGDPNHAMYLNDLGVPLYDRFLKMGVIDDLEECIRITGQAVGMTPDYHPKQAMYSSNLGVYLNNRYLRIGAMADLEAAIRLARQAVDATPRYSPDSAGRLHNLENYLRRRYSRRRTIADLEESIQIARKTVDATPEDHPNRAIYLDGLGYALSDRYAIKGVIADQEEAMRLARQAVNATPIDSTLWAPRLGILGISLMAKHSPKDARGRGDTIKEITAHLQSVLRQRNAEVITRIQAARAVLPACTFTLHWEQAYEVANVAISLVPKLTPRSLENSDKQHVLRQVAGVASDAAALALQAGKALVALDFLEQGRGILATSLEEMRADTLSLRYRYPDLAERFAQLRNELELSDTRDTSFLDQSSWKTQGIRRYDAGNELDKVIVEIRKQSGFEDFLTAPSEKEMQAAAASGPIVVINVSKYRCDSVLIEKHQIRVLALPLLNIKEIKNRAQRLIQGSPTTLEWLWNVAASPILDALGFVQPPTADNWPHVWWITTGPLSTFPLHTAGLHSSGSAETVLDRVISSYSLSIKTIIRSRSRHITLQGPARAILVAMQNTPEHSRLPFAAREVAVLHDICKLTGLDPIKPPRRKQDVIQHLPNCKIFHFAGHGYTDATNPSHSHMLLEDWKTDPLTVATLLEMNLNESSPFLAYLSACGTGQIKNDRLVDESIHLISACQLAGFRHVIGTLWEVNDELCVDMARITYESMRNGNMTDISVCRGLHNATRELRDRWLLRMSSKIRRGSRSVTMVDVSFVKDKRECRRANYVAPKNDGLPRDAVLCDDDGYDDDVDDDGDDEGTESLHWVPYVHFGV